MKGLTGGGYKGGDDIACIAEREPYLIHTQIATESHYKALKNTSTKTNARAKRQLCNST